MENNNTNLDEVNFETMRPWDAAAYIEKYYRAMGFSANVIDWQKRPANLPPDVNKAWDILEEDQDDYEATYVPVPEGNK